MACVLLVTLVAATDTVIASPTATDQAMGAAGTAAESTHSYLPLLIWGILAIGLLWVWIRFRWIALPAQRIPDGDVAAMGGAMGGFILAFMMLILGAVGYGIAQGSADPEADPDLRSMFVGMLGAVIAQLPVAIYFLVKCADRKSLVTSKILKLIGLGLIGFVFVFPIVYFILDLGQGISYWWTGTVDDGVAHSGLLLMVSAEDKTYLWPVLVIVILITPLLEEILYRGFVQRGFRTLGLPPWAAILAASLPFTMMHVGVVEPAALAGLFVLSLGFGWIYERGGSIIAPIVLHSCFNGLNVAYALLVLA